MHSVHGSINVNVPVRQAYNQWARFEEFPLFMSGVESVTQFDAARVHFKVVVGGVRREYDARIITGELDEQITWESVGHPLTGGTVLFESIGPTETKILLRLSWEPDSRRERLGSAVDLDALQAREDLEHFKKFIEGRGGEQWSMVVDDKVGRDVVNRRDFAPSFYETGPVTPAVPGLHAPQDFTGLRSFGRAAVVHRPLPTKRSQQSQAVLPPWE